MRAVCAIKKERQILIKEQFLFTSVFERIVDLKEHEFIKILVLVINLYPYMVMALAYE